MVRPETRRHIQLVPSAGNPSVVVAEPRQWRHWGLNRLGKTCGGWPGLVAAFCTTMIIAIIGLFWGTSSLVEPGFSLDRQTLARQEWVTACLALSVAVLFVYLKVRNALIALAIVSTVGALGLVQTDLGSYVLNMIFIY